MVCLNCLSQWASTCREPIRLLFVIVTYALSDAASFAEIFRGAVRSVDKGQTEAAYAAGMTTFQSFRRIVVPQALIVAFPNMANTLIGSLKDTSLAFSIGVMDMVGRGQTSNLGDFPCF